MRMKTVVYWAILGVCVAATGRTVWAGAVTSGGREIGTGPAGEQMTFRRWLHAAAEQVEAVGPPRYMGTQIPTKKKSLYREIINEMVGAGEHQEAKSLVLEHAPDLAPELAEALGKAGDAPMAFGLMDDAKEGGKAIEIMAFGGLVDGGHLEEAGKYLAGRPKDARTGLYHAKLARARMKSRDKTGAEADLKAARENPSKDLAKTESDDLHYCIAWTLAQKGEYEEAAKEQALIDKQDYRKNVDLALEAKVRRGEIKPNDAAGLIPKYRSTDVFEAILEVQIGAKDIEGLAQTLDAMREKGISMNYYDFPSRVIDCHVSAGKLKEAEELAGRFRDVSPQIEPGIRALMYGRTAAGHLAAGQRAEYERVMGLAIESAQKVVDPSLISSFAMRSQNEILGDLSIIQMDLGDLQGAQKTIGLMKPDAMKSVRSAECMARELVTKDRVWEAQAWVEKLPDAEDRTQACLVIAKELSRKGKP